MAEKRPNATIGINTLWPIILTALLGIVHLLYPSRVWITLLWMMGGLTALGAYWARQMAHGISVSRTLLFGWVQVGDRLQEQFTLTNDSRVPMLWGEVVDRSDLPGYSVGRVATCSPLGVARWTTEKECTRRGLYTLGPWSLRVSDPFGIFSVTFDHDETTAIIVYPPVVHLPEITLPQGRVAGRSRARRRVTEATIDASQTRLYQPSDPLRLIHWPSTAHRGELIVREPDIEISGDLWVVLDLDKRVQAGLDQESTEEYGVILAASLAERTLRQNRSVGLLAHGVELTMVSPNRGTGHLWRILQALAAVKAGGTRRLAEVLHGMRETLGRGATVLAITPSCEPDWVEALLPLTRLGVTPTVVLLDPESFVATGITVERSAGEKGASAYEPVTDSRDPAGTGRPFGSTRRMQELLAEASITTHVIRQGYPFRHVVPPRRRGHWVFRTSPLGRAVVVRRPEEA